MTKLFTKISDKEDRPFLDISEHKLKTPLGGIRWSLEILLDELKDKISKENLESLKEVYTTNLKQIQTVSDFFIIMRIREGVLPHNPKAVNIIELIDEVTKGYEEKDQTRIEINTPENFEFEVDPTLFKLVFDNLLSNALKFDQEGSISVNLKVSDFIQIEFIDNGIGIPKDEQDRVFELFYRASNVAVAGITGSGAGLTISKSIVEGWGGSIEFKSKQDKGATFIVKLPKQLKDNFKLETIKNG